MIPGKDRDPAIITKRFFNETIYFKKYLILFLATAEA